MISILLVSLSYFSVYSSDAAEAMRWMDANASMIATEASSLTPQQIAIAKAIVAPEVSQYSHVLDYVQLRSLYFTYIYQGVGDFSVGRFQMKPSFLEEVERDIAADAVLKKRYGHWLKDITAAPDDKARRRERLKRLEDDRWQVRYLVMFMALAEKRTAGRRFATPEDKVRHFATLYNSGLHISDAKAEQMKKRKLFPRDNRDFNYADIAAEFFKRFK